MSIEVNALVRVIAGSKFRGQRVRVLRIEHNSLRRRKIGTWYLLDTHEPKRKLSHPVWFERHEIEPVEVSA